MIYRTKTGDTWDSIAKELYGDERKIGILMEDNPQHLETVVFGDGVYLWYDELKPSTAGEMPAWRA